MSHGKHKAQRLNRLRTPQPNGHHAPPARPPENAARPPENAPCPAAPAARVPWLPDDGGGLDPELLKAAQAVVAPIYQQLVIDAADALEKTLGASLAHLAWLELVKQFEIKKQLIESAELGVSIHGELDLKPQLRLIDTKLRLGRLLNQCRDLHPVAAPDSAPTPAPAPAAPKSSAASAAGPFSAASLAKAGTNRESALLILRHLQQKVSAGLATLDSAPQTTPPATAEPNSPKPA